MDHTMDAIRFNEVIQQRRSVFPYQFQKGKIVSDEIIWQILENANRAPTHKITAPWRFTVFSGEGLAQFSHMQTETYSKYAGEKFNENKLKNLREYPLMSSHVIAVGMKRTLSFAIPQSEELIAVACAVENIYLSLAAYGLGGYLSTGGITYFKEAKTLFDLEEADQLIGFFYIGYPENLSASISKRTPIQEKVKWIR